MSKEHNTAGVQKTIDYIGYKILKLLVPVAPHSRCVPRITLICIDQLHTSGFLGLHNLTINMYIRFLIVARQSYHIFKQINYPNAVEFSYDF